LNTSAGKELEMAEISEAVGPHQTNRPADVKTIQDLLNRNLQFLIPLEPLKVDGRLGPATETMIKEFQSRVLKMHTPDGRIMPKGPTMRSLVCHAAPSSPVVTTNSSKGATLAFSDYVEAGRRLSCEPAAVMAVVMTEVGIRGPFDSQGRPTILFERHVFSRLTGRKFDASYPDISNPVPGGYGYFSAQYTRLQRASELDHAAAQQSASWGAFQIMGENFKQAGFGSVDEFVAAMKTSTKNQMAAFTTFIINDRGLMAALQQKDWKKFARKYNGPSYEVNHYDIKMKHNYEQALNSHVE
jgi:peptidoglycan hydrolase-like protein with peptidoglycan-binding domain